MRILQLISSSGFYGAENVVLQLSAELAKLGHEVTVGVFHDFRGPNLELAQRARSRKLDVREFKCRGRWDRNAVKEISEFVRTCNVDVVHSHGYKANAYARLARAGTSIQLVSTCHNWIESSLKMRLYNALDRWCLRGFDLVIAVSRPVMGKLLRAGVARAKISLIGNGVDMAAFDGTVDLNSVRREFGFDPDDRIVGTVGRLSAEKGHGELLRACAELIAQNPHCRILVVGDGPLKDSLQSLAAALGVGDRAVFCGKRSDVASLLKVMDIFVLPSLTEGQPMALLEAMAAGCPVIATAVGDVPEILADGDAGVLVTPGDSSSLAKALALLLQDRASRLKLSASAKTRVREKYSAAGMARAYVQAYGTAPRNDAAKPAETPALHLHRSSCAEMSPRFDREKKSAQ